MMSSKVVAPSPSSKGHQATMPYGCGTHAAMSGVPPETRTLRIAAASDSLVLNTITDVKRPTPTRSCKVFMMPFLQKEYVRTSPFFVTQARRRQCALSIQMDANEHESI